MGANLFLELLQVSVGNRDSLSRVPSDVEWEQLFSEAQRHAITGMMACGIDRLPREQQPPKVVRVQWAGQVLQIEQRNLEMTGACSNLCRRLEQDGFYCCVLKGQANHAYYPQGMGTRRNSGDIDIWVVPEKGDASKFNAYSNPVWQTVEYAQEKLGMTGLCWLHASGDVGGLPVEVHFHPSFFSRPKYNRRFKKHFSDITVCVEMKTVDGVEIPAMKVDKDVVYQMNHIYRHLIDEGVGLRQIVDYFYCLKTYGLRLKEGALTPSRESIMRTVEYLGMKRFAGALMYVLREVLGMSGEYLLCEPSVKDGQFLVDEILLSGNFGHKDPRMNTLSSEGGYFSQRFNQAARRFKRNLRFVSSYPGEVFWEPIVRVEHFVWKKLKLWRWR